MAPTATELTIVIEKALGKLNVLGRRVASNTSAIGGKWTEGKVGATAVYQTDGGEDILAVINPLKDGIMCKTKLIYPAGMEEDVQEVIKEARVEFEKEKLQL